MKNKTKSGIIAKNKYKDITITFVDMNAKKIFVAGEFNEWDPDVAPMEKIGEGKWCLKLKLPIGRYEYKYVVDGEWCCEPGCEGDHHYQDCVHNAFGSMNRILEVV